MGEVCLSDKPSQHKNKLNGTDTNKTNPIQLNQNRLKAETADILPIAKHRLSSTPFYSSFCSAPNFCIKKATALALSYIWGNEE